MHRPATDTPDARLRTARERAGLTQTQAAARMVPPIDQRTWAKAESGRWTPTLDWLYRAAAALGIDPHELDGRLASIR
jgi:transcriptional regulator with XRE-family HTH domain